MTSPARHPALLQGASNNSTAIVIRLAEPADAQACGRIMFEAFENVARRHGFTPDFPSIAAAIELARSFISHPSVHAVVAEEEGQVVGSNFINEGDSIRGIGPITVDSAHQGTGIGRKLMEAVIERASGATGVRLLQDSFNMGSIALYAALGFEVREPMLVMAGRPATSIVGSAAVRPMTAEDVDACNALCNRAHGFARASELSDALRLLQPLVCERDGRITGYLTAPTLWIVNHGVAETDGDMKDLILGASRLLPDQLSFLLPVRRSGLFRWCLEVGFRAAKPMTLMSIGEYREPEGSYLPSVFY